MSARDPSVASPFPTRPGGADSTSAATSTSAFRRKRTIRQTLRPVCDARPRTRNASYRPLDDVKPRDDLPLDERPRGRDPTVQEPASPPDAIELDEQVHVIGRERAQDEAVRSPAARASWSGRPHRRRVVHRPPTSARSSCSTPSPSTSRTRRHVRRAPSRSPRAAPGRARTTRPLGVCRLNASTATACGTDRASHGRPKHPRRSRGAWRRTVGDPQCPADVLRMHDQLDEENSGHGETSRSRFVRRSHRRAHRCPAGPRPAARRRASTSRNRFTRRPARTSDARIRCPIDVVQVQHMTDDISYRPTRAQRRRVPLLGRDDASVSDQRPPCGGDVHGQRIDRSGASRAPHQDAAALPEQHRPREDPRDATARAARRPRTDRTSAESQDGIIAGS